MMLTRSKLERVRNVLVISAGDSETFRANYKPIFDHIESLESTLRRAQYILRGVEWHRSYEPNDDDAYCPICGRGRRAQYHNAENCKLAALIREITDAVGGDK